MALESTDRVSKELDTKQSLIQLWVVGAHISTPYHQQGRFMRPKHLKPLTSLRFFAALPIVIFHMQGALLHMDSTPSLALGVSFFFVLSGFILAYSHPDEVEWKSFARSRVARLWPLHLVTAVLWIAIANRGILATFGAPEIFNLLLLQAWIPVSAFVFSLNPVAWSISVEVFFYCLFPFIRGRRLYAVTAGTFALTISILILMDALFDPGFPAWKTPGTIWTLHVALQFPFMRLAEFCLGIVTAQRFKTHRMSKPSSALEAVAVFLVIAFGFMSKPIYETLGGLGLPHIGIWLSQSGGMFIFAFAIYVFAHESGRISAALSKPVIVFLGEISFATYMVHFLALTVISEHLKSSSSLNPYLVGAVYLLATYVLSAVAFKFVERPGRRLLSPSPATNFLRDAKQ